MTTDLFGEVPERPRKRPPLLNLPVAKAARDDGTARAIKNERAEWMDKAVRLLTEFSHQRVEFTAEEFRNWWVSRQLEPPHTHKVWGALFLRAASAGTIINTQIYRKAASVKTHAHPVPLWKAV